MPGNGSHSKRCKQAGEFVTYAFLLRNTPSSQAITTESRIAMIEKLSLIVEDNPDYLNIMQDLLALEGFKVFTAGTLFDALHFIAVNDRLDFAMLDINLPDGLGITLIAPLREKFQDIVIVLIGEAEPPLPPLKALQPNAFLPKPIHPRDLKREIHKHFQARP